MNVKIIGFTPNPEKTAAMAIAGIAATLSKLATDICMYMSQNFEFLSLPDEFSTGSSIMPHKKIRMLLNY